MSTWCTTTRSAPRESAIGKSETRGDIGEDGGCPYHFTPENYLTYYQHTAAAILRADPDARVGGPAVANYRSALLPVLLDFGNAGKAPVHFVSWHIYSSDPTAVRHTIDYVHELLAKRPNLKVETFLDEWNMSLSHPVQDPRFQPAYVVETAWQMVDAGLRVHSCYYHIRDYYVDVARFSEFMSARGAAFMARWWNRMPQFDGLFDYQGTVRPACYAFKLLRRLTGDRLKLDSSDPTVHGLFSYDPLYLTHNLLLVNYSDKPVRLAIDAPDAPGKLFAAAGTARRRRGLLRRERAPAAAGAGDGREGSVPHRNRARPLGSGVLELRTDPVEVRRSGTYESPLRSPRHRGRGLQARRASRRSCVAAREPVRGSTAPATC